MAKIGLLFLSISIFCDTLFATPILQNEDLGLTNYRPIAPEFPTIPLDVKEAKNIEHDLSFKNKILITAAFDYKAIPNLNTEELALPGIHEEGKIFKSKDIFPTITNRVLMDDTKYRGDLNDAQKVDGPAHFFTEQFKDLNKDQDLTVFFYVGHGQGRSTKYPDGGLVIPRGKICKEYKINIEVLDKYLLPLSTNSPTTMSSTDVTNYSSYIATLTNSCQQKYQGLRSDPSLSQYSDLLLKEEAVIQYNNEYVTKYETPGCVNTIVPYKAIGSAVKNIIHLNDACHSSSAERAFENSVKGSYIIASAANYKEQAWGEKQLSTAPQGDILLLQKTISTFESEIIKRIKYEACILDNGDHWFTIKEFFTDFPTEMSRGLLRLNQKYELMTLEERKLRIQKIYYDRAAMLGEDGKDRVKDPSTGAYIKNDKDGFSRSISTSHVTRLETDAGIEHLVVRYLSKSECEKYKNEKYEDFSINKHILNKLPTRTIIENGHLSGEVAGLRDDKDIDQYLFDLAEYEKKLIDSLKKPTK